jgi:hypothetical protein
LKIIVEPVPTAVVAGWVIVVLAMDAVAVGDELSVLAVAVLAAAMVNAVAPRSVKPARAIVRT